MPRSKRCKLPTSPERKNSRSFLSKLRSILSVFRCTGMNSVRVQPTHISVRPATATMDVRDGDRRPKTPSVFFSSSSSRPSTAIRPTTKGCSHLSACQEPIRVSTPLDPSSDQRDQVSISDMNAASGTPISVDRSVEVPVSNLQGLGPSPATSATIAITDASNISSSELLDVPRAPRYFRTNLTQLRKMQRQKRLEERRKKEEIFGKRPRKVTFNPVLEEELKPKKRLSEQIRDEEAAIKEMQQMLVDLDQDETEVLKKMQELQNWRIKIQHEKDYFKYMNKDAQLNDVILILEDRLHMLKNCGQKIGTKIGYRKEKLTQLKVDYELLLATGSSEEVETEELLKQFLPTLGISSDNFSITNLDDFLKDDEDLTPRPGSRNPVAAQLLGEGSTMNELQKPSAGLLPDILNEYHHTLMRDLPLTKKNNIGQTEVNDGMKKFMLSQMQSGNIL